MNTIELCEALLYKIPDIRKAFIGLNIMNLERKISASEHPEFKNILKPFNNPKVISVVGLTHLTAIVEPIRDGKVYHTILIQGKNAEITAFGKTKMINILFQHLKLKDFLPPPLVKKIIFIDSYKDKLLGLVFSEYRNGMWTIDDPLQIPLTSCSKMSGKVILNEVISEMLN